MAKNIPAKDFKEAVKSLNVKLKEDGETPIKLVGVKKEAVVESFTNTVLDFIENYKAEELPDNVIELYNTYIVADDEEDEEEKPAKKTTGKKTSTKKPSTKKPSTKKPKHFIPNESGRPKFIVEAIQNGGTQDEIVAAADKLYVKSGGTSNVSQSKRLFENAVRYLYYAGAVKISEDGVYSFK